MKIMIVKKATANAKPQSFCGFVVDDVRFDKK
jgi:hypothetical protein